MATYSEWLGTTKTAFANAMSSAYTNRNTAGNDFYLAWQDMTATSDLSSILPPGSTAFWNTGGPSAGEAEIILFRDWLQDNPVTAGRLGLEPTLAFRSELRSALGNAGTIGGEKRRWKGKPLYTFANGVVVGKDGNIAAAIGTEGGTDIEGFGTDTISFFDGIPFATGTGTPGSTVFAGDTVHSGSIRGTGGVVIIPDVIQLEQDDSITSPAGIGVDSAGKIRLRHRGEGFLDLVDEIATAETDATNAAKLFTAAQNTSSGRFGMSLIPNSNFSYKSINPTTFTETFANIISVGTTSNILSEPTGGVGEFEANAGGICFTAFPTTSERYAVRIRFEGDVVETTDDSTAAEGLFVTFNETTDDLPDGKYYVFNDANIGPSSGDYEGSEVHTSNVTVVTPLLSDGGYATTDGGGNVDGLTISNSMSVRSFLYKPSAGAKNASMVIFAKNFGDGSDRSIRIDYIVLNESPKTTSEIDSIVDLAVADIVGEDDLSIVPDKHMADKTQWATRGTSVTLTDTDDGGDPAEDAIQAVFGSGGGGIISSAIQCESDRYLVGCKIKVTDASSGDPVISMFSIENLSPAYPTIGGADTSPITSGNENGINIMEVSAASSYSGTATSSVTLTDDGSFHTLLGTYETTVTYMDDQGITYTTYDPARTPHGTTPIQLPSVFSLGIQVDKPCTLLVDYVYGRIQGSSVNIVEGLATAAYTDAEGFVTAMNELVIKESGSIITNSSMGYLDSNGKPAGWATPTNCTLTFDNTGDYAITISRTGAGTRRLITPTFNLGAADKFSVGIRIKSTTSSAITPVIKIATSTESIIPSPYSTIAEDDGGTTNVVYTGNTTVDATLTMSPTSTTAGNYETMLSTWNRTSETEQTFVGGMASVIIECPDDFTVDYVFVKEQTVSFDLADAQAEARRDEAIAEAAGFVADIGDSIAAETGSLLTNADFTSWYKDGGLQRPQKWLLTRGATSPRRAIRTTEVSNEIYAQDSTARDAETTDDVNQTGSSIRFSPSAGSGGILSAKWQLPIQDETGVAAGTATTGAYTLTARVKVGSASVIGVRLYAHESFEFTDAAQEHVFCEDGTYGSGTVEGADRTATGTPLDTLFMFADGVTTGQVTRVGVINISNPNDTTPGYDPNYTNDGVDNDYADNPNTEGFADDQFVEYIPLDTDGSNYEDGDLDSTIENHNLWYDIGGTFKPDAKTKCVSFEILIDGDPDSTGGAPTNVYIDYVSLVQQPFDSDFASTLADARIESLTGIGSAEWTGSANTTLAAALLGAQLDIYNAQQQLAAEDENSTLIPNSFFSDVTSNSPDNWLPTRNTNASLDVEDDATAISNAGSYNTYVTLGGTNDIRGMLSKAVPVIGDGVNTQGLTSGGLSTNPKFDLAIRYKATSTENISFQIIAHEYFLNSYDPSTYKYVYANGGSYIHPTASNAVVQRYNTGVDGQVQSLDTLLNDGVDTTEETEKVTNSSDWQTLVGLYEPHTSANWVSFEFVINHDQDGDDILPDVYVDGILLQASQETPLLASVKETAEAAATTAGNALATAEDAANDVSNLEITVNGHTTTLGNIELAQSEAVIVDVGVSSEQSSLLFNAGFSQSLTSTNQAMPLGFWPYQDTPAIIRIQNEYSSKISFSDNNSGGEQSESSDIFSSPETLYLDVSQTGTAVAVLVDTTKPTTSDYSSGFYTRAMSLPQTSSLTYTDGTGASVESSDRGVFSVGLRVRPGGSNDVSITLLAHEYDTNMDPYNDGNYIYRSRDTYSYRYGEKIGTPVAATRTQTIPLNQLSTTDSTATTHEIIPGGSWTTVGGTYTPTGTAQCVSFSVLFTYDNDDETLDLIADQNPDGPTFWYTDTRAIAFVDYLLITPATFSVNLAQDIAAGEAYEVQQTLTTTIQSVQDGINEQTPGLIFNSDFKNIISSGNKAKGWLIAEATDTYVESKPYDSGVGSIDRYVHLQKEGPSKFASIISKGVGTITDESRNADGSLGTYVIAVKARGKYTDGTNTVSQSSPSGAHLSLYQIHRVSGGTSSSGATSSVVLPSDAGSYRGWHDDDNYELNEQGSTTVYRRYPTPSGTDDGIFEIPVPGKTVKFWATISWSGVDTSGDEIRFIPLLDPRGTPTTAGSPRVSEILVCDDSGTEAGGGRSIAISDYTAFSLRSIANSSSPSGQYFIQVTLSSSNQIEGFKLQTTNLDSSESMTMGALYQAYSQTDLDGDFSLKIIAHESNTPGEATHVVNSGTTFETPHSDLGITTVNSDNSLDLTIIDLGYASAEADTEAEILNEESSLDTWRTIIGSYKPTSEDRSMTSFEFYFDMDEDGDSLYQQIYIDSVTLQKSSIDGDVAESIAENRVFLESNQTMGGATVSNNNILFNADFSLPQGETSATRSPAGWYPLREYNQTHPSVATPLGYVGSNRDLRFDTSEECHGAVSKAFSIDYDKYRVRLTLDLNGADHEKVQIKYWATTGTPGFLEKCICASNVWPTISSGISYHSATNAGNVQNGITEDTGIYTVEYEWNPYGTNDNWEDAWNWASIGVYYNSSSSVEIIVKSLEVYPIGFPFTRTSLGRGSVSRGFGGGIFDLGGRGQFYETNVPEPLYDAIDIAIDTDTTVTQALLMSEVRYEYGTSSGGGGSTAKYKYPAESPVEISDSSSRTTITVKPTGKYNTLSGLQYVNLSNNNGSVGARIDGNNYGLVLAPYPTNSTNPGWDDAVNVIGPLVVAHDNPAYLWDHEDQWYNGTTGILLKQKDNNFYNGLMIQNPAVTEDSNDSGSGVDTYPTWAIYIGDTEKYIRFAYGTNTDLVDTNDHWFMKSEGHMSTNTTNAGRSIGNYLSSYTFTGAHISLPSQEDTFDIGQIVASSGQYNNISFLEGHPLSQKASISESLPTVLLTTKRNQKSVFGVVAEIEDESEPIRKLNNHNALGRAHSKEDNRLIVNSLGEGAVWICNINGNLENGDYITTCEIPGYGMLQDDDLLHNYTVAKITQDCDFDLDNPYYDCVEFEFEGQTYRKAFVGCTYHCG